MRFLAASLLALMMSISIAKADTATTVKDLTGKTCLGNYVISQTGRKDGGKMVGAISFHPKADGSGLMIETRTERTMEAYNNPPKDRPLADRSEAVKAEVNGAKITFETAGSKTKHELVYDPAQKTLNGSNARRAEIKTTCF